MRSGRYRQLIALESPPADRGRDAAGDDLDEWSARGAAWAEVEPLAGRELVAAQAILDTIDTRITMRYSAAIDSRWRATFRGQIYYFSSVRDVGSRRQELEILATTTRGDASGPDPD